MFLNDFLHIEKHQDALELALRIINSSSDIIVICEAEPINEPGPRIIYVNEAFVRETGYTAEEVIGKTPRILQGPKSDKVTIGRIRAALENWQPIREDVLNYKKNGEEFWQELNIFPVADKSGLYTHWVAVQHNITNRRLAEQALKDSHDSFGLAMNVSGIGIWDWDVVNDKLSWDQGMYRLYGINAQNFSGAYESWQKRVHPEDRKMTDEEILNAIKGGEFNSQFRVIWPDRTIRYICGHALVIRDALGVAIRMVGTNWDVTKARLEQIKIEESALLDPLTNLPNRRLLGDRLHQAMLLSQRTKCYRALLFIDLDGFKCINDTHGHLAGDWLLIEVAKRLQQCVRESDTVSRYAGDEFVITFSELGMQLDSTYKEVKKLSEHIRAALEKPYVIPIWTNRIQEKYVEIRCTASIGATLFSGEHREQEQIISLADAAMYLAKNAGGNQVQFSKLPIKNSNDRADLGEENLRVSELALQVSNNRADLGDENLLKLKKEIFASQDETISLLVALASFLDDETGAHLIQTQKYILALATRLILMGKYTDQLDAFTIENLCQAAPLHDIGKVAIPDSILRKQNRLTEAEWTIMMTHAAIGARILTSYKGGIEYQNKVIKIASEIAGNHHEKWNGTGYPAGLSGESIPLVARIMSLADMYDALVSERPYKKAWTHEKASAEIIKNKGIAFDPVIVEAFVLEQDHFKEIANKYFDR